MPNVVAGILLVASVFGAIYAGARVGAWVDRRTRSLALAWIAGLLAFIVIGTALQLALRAAIPDYGWRVDRITDHAGGDDPW
jgi:hypothetical protein